MYVGVPSLILTTEPFSMGSFCPRPVNITCTGTEISTVLLWKNGSVELVEYGYRSTHNGSFPRTVILEVPLQGVTAEVTTATLSSTAIDIVSTLFVVNVSVLDGYSISCEDNLGRRSEELNIRVQPQGWLINYCVYTYLGLFFSSRYSSLTFWCFMFCPVLHWRTKCCLGIGSLLHYGLCCGELHSYSGSCHFLMF